MTSKLPGDPKAQNLTDVDRYQKIINLRKTSDPKVSELNEYLDEAGSKGIISLSSRSPGISYSGTSMPSYNWDNSANHNFSVDKAIKAKNNATTIQDFPHDVLIVIFDDLTVGAL